MKSINVSATDSWWALERIALVTPKLTQTQEDKRNNDKVSSDNPVSMCTPMSQTTRIFL